MGALMRSLDWSDTPVGAVESWPQSLRTAVSICLGSRHPIEIWWGPEYVRFYNDAYRPILGANKHPQFLGRPGRECWGEIWDEIGPMLDSVMETGNATWSEDYPLMVTRNGYLEETYFTFSYGPLRIETGAVGGIFCACTETTGRVLGERRLRTLRDLASRSAEAKEVTEACGLAADALAANPHDIPFALLYLIDESGTEARLAASVRMEPGNEAAPLLVRLDEPGHSAQGWPLGRAVESGEEELLEDLAERFGPMPGGAWPESSHSARLLPLTLRGRSQATAVLIAGINPRKRFDPEYATFLDMMAEQITRAIADAFSYQEEKEHAAALSERERIERTRLTNVFMQAPAFIAVLQGPEHVFELANPPYYQLIGHRELIGKSVREALPDIAGQGFYEILDEVYRTGKPFIGTDVRIVLRKDPSGPQEEYIIDFTYQPLVASDGSSTGIFVHGIDLTQRKRAEEERARLLMLEQAAREELELQRDQLSQTNLELIATSEVLRNQQERQAVVVRYLRGTNRAAALLTKAESVAEIVDGVVGTLSNEFRASACGIWLASPNGRILHLAGERGFSGLPTRSFEPEIEVTLHPYKIGWVARYKRPFVSSDIAGDVHFDHQWTVDNKIVSAAVLPLLFQEELLGVMVACFAEELPLEASEVLATLASVTSASLGTVRGQEERSTE